MLAATLLWVEVLTMVKRLKNCFFFRMSEEPKNEVRGSTKRAVIDVLTSHSAENRKAKSKTAKMLYFT